MMDGIGAEGAVETKRGPECRWVRLTEGRQEGPGSKLFGKVWGRGQKSYSRQVSGGVWKAASPPLLTLVLTRARVELRLEADVWFLPAGPQVGSLCGGPAAREVPLLPPCAPDTPGASPCPSLLPSPED